MFEIIEQYNFYFTGDVTQVGPFMAVMLDTFNRLRIYYNSDTYLPLILSLFTSNVVTTDTIADIIMEIQFLSDTLFNQLMQNISIPGVVIIHRIPGSGGNFIYDNVVFGPYDTFGVYGE